MKKGIKVFSIFVSSAVVIAAGTFAWMNYTVELQGSVAPVKPLKEIVIRPIPTARVQKVLNTKVREFPGTVRAAQRVELAFSVMGKIEVLNAREGEVFDKGDVIASLDKRDFQNAVAVSQAQLGEITKNLKRTKELFDKKVTSAMELDRMQAQYDVAAANLEIQKKALEDTVIYAPFAGVVAERYVENHEHVKAQAPVLSFQDISRVEIVIQIPEQLMFQGGTKNLQNFQVQYQGDKGRWRKLEVFEHRVQADPITQTFDIILAQNPPKDYNVLPGMNATVSFESPILHASGNETPREVLVVPIESLFCEGNGSSWTWVIEDSIESTPRKVQVQTGSLREDGVEILEGLQAGQLVATSGLSSLTETTHVRPMKSGREGLEG